MIRFLEVKGQSHQARAHPLYVNAISLECSDGFSWIFAQMSKKIQGWNEDILEVRDQRVNVHPLQLSMIYKGGFDGFSANGANIST